MPLVRVKSKAQITLPAQVRRALNIKEGDYLRVEIEDGVILMAAQNIDDRPPVALSAEGERMLEEALEDMREGRTRSYPTVQAMIEDLHRGR